MQSVVSHEPGRCRLSRFPISSLPRAHSGAAAWLEAGASRITIPRPKQRIQSLAHSGSVRIRPTVALRHIPAPGKLGCLFSALSFFSCFLFYLLRRVHSYSGISDLPKSIARCEEGASVGKIELRSSLWFRSLIVCLAGRFSVTGSLGCDPTG